MAASAPRSIRDLIPLARHLSHQLAAPVEPDDLVQEALLWAHKDFARIQRAANPYALARTVMTRAMWRLYHNGAIKRARRFEEPLTPLTDVAAITDMSTQTRVTEQIMFDEFLAALERQCGADARRVAENLIRPSEECSWSLLSETIQKRRARDWPTRRHQTRPRGGALRARVSGRMIREGLGYSSNRWMRLMRAVKEFTVTWVAANR